MPKKEQEQKQEQEKSKTEKKSGSLDKNKKIKIGIRTKVSSAIILLIVVILVSIVIYFINRESEVFIKNTIESIQREITHLSVTAQESIGIDELAIVTAIKNLQKVSSIDYIFVLNSEDEIIQGFDRNNEITPGVKLEDEVDRTHEGDPEAAKISLIKDQVQRGITIYDFSLPVLHKFDQRPIGMVIIGFSDREFSEEIQKMIVFTVTVSLVFILISIIGSILLTNIIINPIRKLSKGVDEIGKGNFDYKIKLNSSDELGLLANEFNNMASQIFNSQKKEIESALMEEQMEMAKSIQEGLNPMGYYNKKGLQIKGFTRAAKGVGGDYFDYIDIDEHRVGVLISDVAGKGVPASLVMVMIRTVFATYIKRSDVDCVGVVSAINDALSADFAIDKFASLFFMIYDRRTEELSFSNAGHGPLVCYRADKKAVTVSKIDGLPIGVMEDSEYVQAKVKFNPGDMVILFTDGITEMRNINKDEYGIVRVHNKLIENCNLNAKEFIEDLITDVDDFKGEAAQHDDTTVVLFKRAE